MDRSGALFTLQVVPKPGATPISVDESMALILGWEFEDKESAADKLTFEVDNYDLALFDRSPPLFADGMEVRFQFGWPGTMSLQRRATIQKVTGTKVLKIEALGGAILMHKITLSRAFNDMKRSDVAKAIAAEYGFTGAQLVIDDTAEVLTQITQARMTDAAFLRDLAHREGFEWYVDATGFHFHKRRPGAKPVRRLEYFTDPNEGDIISFDVEGDLTARPAAVAAVGLDAKTKKPIVATASNAEGTARDGLATEVAPDPYAKVDAATGLVTKNTGTNTSPNSGVHTIATTEKTQASAQRHADGVFTKSASAAVKLKFSCIGDPNICAKTVIEAAGISAKLSGNYYVTTARHRGRGAYMMELEGRRDGGALAATSAASKAKVNSADAPANAGEAADALEQKVIVDPATGAKTTIFVEKRAQ